MKGILEWEDSSVYDYYLAVFNFFSFNMAVRWLSFVDGYCCTEIKTKNKDYAFQPFVSIIVPRYNEGKVIEKRIIRDSHL
ncbi:hypothetical protein C5S31_01300 [ANME-1 cluster archaeon GoMg2]|nr:hypothetical protein [ANME-1 cluster archaeon GoMg2]